VATRVTFYRPGKSFPAFSVTGEGCSLQCDHCRGRYLQGMRPALDPDELERAAARLSFEGGRGFLLSGGCDRRGRVPLGDFSGAVRRIRATTGLQVNVHPGLLDEEDAAAVISSGAEAFSVDVVQDPLTISGTLHLQASPRDYCRTMELLEPTGRLVPHVCVGLQSERGEEGTLETISAHSVRALIILGLMGARGTMYEHRSVPPERLVRAVGKAVATVPAPVLLGCMRPRGQWEVEVQAIEDGAAGVVNPSPRTVQWALDQGYRVENVPSCCALHL